MSSNGDEPPITGDKGDFAKALEDLAKGEQTADSLERHLDGLEKKIEELLEAASADSAETNSKDDAGKAKPNGA